MATSVRSVILIAISCMVETNHSTDIFVVNAQGTELQVWLWNSGPLCLILGAYNFSLLETAIISSSSIQSVVATDFNFDGILDVLLQNQTQNMTITSYVYYGKDQASFTVPVFVAESVDQLNVVDWSNNQLPDLYGTALGPNGTQVRTIWINNGALGFTAIPHNASAALFQPNSNAVVDFNGKTRSPRPSLPHSLLSLNELKDFSILRSSDRANSQVTALQTSSFSLKRPRPGSTRSRSGSTTTPISFHRSPLSLTSLASRYLF
jgi:hypothetical protein